MMMMMKKKRKAKKKRKQQVEEEKKVQERMKEKLRRLAESIRNQPIQQGEEKVKVEEERE